MTNIKRFRLTIEVDEEALINSYTGNDKTINKDDLPLVDELILFECGWLSSSGIQVVDVKELLANTTISIEWNIEDVQEVALERFNKTLANNDALVVLKFLKEQHDATIGISWMVIEEAIKTLLERKEIK